MPNIIKPGVLPETKTARATCDHCGCIFEFAKHEAQMHDSYQGTSYSLPCPTCKRDVYVYGDAFK